MRWKRIPGDQDAFGDFVLVASVALLLVAAGANVLLAGLNPGDAQPHYVLQAEAFLHGRLDIDGQGLKDVAVYQGRAYVAFPPGPALVLLPVVAVLGVGQTNPNLLGLLLAAITVFAVYRALPRLGVDGARKAWYVVAFSLGTGYWFAVLRSSQVWFFAHVVAVLFMMLALGEATGRARAWLAGTYMAMAMLSRQLALFTVPLIGVLLWNQARSRTEQPWRDLLRFAVPIAVAGVGYLAFNAARFGHVLDTGYGHIPLEGFLAERVAQFGLFSVHYLPFNLVYMFLQGWHASFGGPAQLQYQSVDPFGTSLLVASPFLLAVFWAQTARSVKWAAWLGIVAAMGIMLLYYNNGWAQANTQRFSLDILPALFFLFVKAGPRLNLRFQYAAIAYAVALNILTLIVFPLLTV